MENEVPHACFSSDGESCFYGNYTIDDFYEELMISSESPLTDQLHSLLYQHFDLTKGKLIKFFLLKDEGAEKTVYYFISVAHHILMDAAEAVSLVQQIETSYNRLWFGQGLQFGVVKHFTDAVLEEKQFLAKTDKAVRQRFWLDFIDDTPLSIDLPYQQKAGVVEGKKGRAIYFDLDIAQKQQLKAYARAQSTTVFTVISGVFGFVQIQWDVAFYDELPG